MSMMCVCVCFDVFVCVVVFKGLVNVCGCIVCV